MHFYHLTEIVAICAVWVPTMTQAAVHTLSSSLWHQPQHHSLTPPTKMPSLSHHVPFKTSATIFLTLPGKQVTDSVLQFSNDK